MCLIFIAWHCHPAYPLVVAANRDEFHARPTAPAGWWVDAPEVLGGRDLEAGGTWLGVTRAGRFAAITNYRDGASPRPGAPTRGALIGDFLCAGMPARVYLDDVAARGGAYNGFSMIAHAGDMSAWTSNRAGGVHALAAGVHGLSNHLMDTAWPKVTRGKAALSRVLDSEHLSAGVLLALLDDRGVAPDAELPDTGVDLGRERWLSPRFVVGEDYGTRSSTVVLVDATGRVAFTERSFDHRGEASGEVHHEFVVARAQ